MISSEQMIREAYEDIRYPERFRPRRSWTQLHQEPVTMTVGDVGIPGSLEDLTYQAYATPFITSAKGTVARQQEPAHTSKIHNRTLQALREGLLGAK